MKHTIEFNVSPEDDEGLKYFMAGMAMYSVIRRCLEGLRVQLKYKELPDDVDKALETVRDLLLEDLNDEGIRHLF